MPQAFKLQPVGDSAPQLRSERKDIYALAERIRRDHPKVYRHVEPRLQVIADLLLALQRLGAFHCRQQRGNY